MYLVFCWVFFGEFVGSVIVLFRVVCFDNLFRICDGFDMRIGNWLWVSLLWLVCGMNLMGIFLLFGGSGGWLVFR